MPVFFLWSLSLDRGSASPKLRHAPCSEPLSDDLMGEVMEHGCGFIETNRILAWLLGCLAAWLLGCLAAWLLGCCRRAKLFALSVKVTRSSRG
jgi:hypothetical protein